ncbi:MFS transporter [Jannaschia sp. Os4]|uniref:MFS transporter n=1 Tax=Jannaschia sp. Os4 TaxID=2807617 RepID=UPI0019397C43|nr:MFS transporter [Jannaschia sp. Os4]MBM2576884.1 MFS transporter [Jannaschia sp. Os4]
MIPVMRQSWPLFIGMFMLMVGNGIQGTLLGVRGGLEGFSTDQMSIVMAGYFGGFLLGSQLVPGLIRNVGHVRVFAALGSTASACLILFPLLPYTAVWIALRVLLGFCFCGVYIVAESWLNSTTRNDMRGRALSLYIFVQMAGIVAAQALFGAGDAGDFSLFVIVSVLVSMAFAPVLLSAVPVPPFESAKPMSLRRLWNASPLGFVGLFLLGGVYAAMFGMVGVWGSLAGLGQGQIAAFAATTYLGAAICQMPVGWLSDRMDRRRVIAAVAAIGAVACLVATLRPEGTGFTFILGAAFVMGGMANPLYALLLAYTNDYLETEEMAAASARLLFVNGIGAIGGPILLGRVLEWIGPRGFFAFVGALLGAVALYALWRMTRRASADSDGGYVPLAPSTVTPVTITTAVEEYADAAEAPEEAERAA